MAETQVLEAALIGLEHQCSQLDEKMAELRRRLGIRGRGVRVSSVAHSISADATAALAGKQRRMSAAGRRRIAEAQRKRWAAVKQDAAEDSMPEKKKRKISAAGRARMAATKKRWAEYRAKKTAKRTPKNRAAASA